MNSETGSSRLVRGKVLVSPANGTLAGPRTEAPLEPMTALEPNWFLLAIIFLIPLQNIYLGKIPSLGAGINILNLLLLFATITWLTRKDLGHSEPPTLKKLVVAILIWWTLSLGIGVFTLGSLYEGHFEALKDFFVPLLLYFVTYHSVKSRRALLWVIGATLLPLPYMFKVVHAQTSGLFTSYYDDAKKNMIHGTFMLLGSNEIAAFYSTYTLVLLGLLLLTKEVLWRAILFGLLCLNVNCWLFTYSRGAWIALPVGLFAMGWLLNRPKTIAITGIVIALSGPIIALLPGPIAGRVSTIFASGNEMDNSSQSRFDFWAIAFDQFKKDPIFGIGYHTFVHVNPYHMDTHNAFVKFLCEQGLIGLGIILTLFVRSATLSWRVAKSTEDPLYRGLCAGLFGAIVSLFVCNLFGDRFTHYPLIAYFWVYLGAVEAINRNMQNDALTVVRVSDETVLAITSATAAKVPGERAGKSRWLK